MLAGGVLVVAGLVACNSAEADPEPEPTTPALPETTEADSQPDPVDPDDEAEAESDELDENPQGPQEYEHPVPAAEIDDDGQAGAEAAAVYFVELYFYVYATGDFEAWDELSAKACGFCEVVRTDTAEIHGDGGYAVARPPEIRGAEAQLDPARSGAYVVEVEFLDTEKQTFDGAGGMTGDYPAADTHAWVLVERDAESWSVLGVEAEVSE